MTHSAALNYKAIVRILGTILFIIGISMIIPWLYAEFAKEPESARAFRICAPITAVFGLLIMVTIKNHTVKFRSREGYLVVALCWLIASIAGAFPYYISGHAGNFLDAIFESTAGFTTTGCTSINAEYTEQSLVLWKAISHWLGGMGILVFVISILPALGINGQYIARAESPGPVLEKMTVRMSDSAKILYLTYFTFTALEFILLMLSGKMPVFDAAVNTMGSISTGGLVVHPAGIIHYDSLYVEIVISVFCILSSVNFVLYHYLITGKPGYLFKDIELRVYLCIIAIAVCICTANLVFVDGLAPGSALRESFFQVVSMATTTGYVRDTSILWPAVYRRLLSFHSRIHQSRSYHRYDEADLARLHQKDPPKICCRCETGRQLHVRFSGYRDYHVYFHLPGRVLHFRCHSLTAGARYGDHFYHDTGYAVQYGDRIRRNIIHHQFLLLPSTAEAVSQRTDDNRQAGAFHDPDPVHQELLG